MTRDQYITLIIMLIIVCVAVVTPMAQAIFLFGDWKCAFINCTYIVPGT